MEQLLGNMFTVFISFTKLQLFKQYSLMNISVQKQNNTSVNLMKICVILNSVNRKCILCISSILSIHSVSSIIIIYASRGKLLQYKFFMGSCLLEFYCIWIVNLHNISELLWSKKTQLIKAYWGQEEQCQLCNPGIVQKYFQSIACLLGLSCPYPLPCNIQAKTRGLRESFGSNSLFLCCCFKFSCPDSKLQIRKLWENLL